MALDDKVVAVVGKSSGREVVKQLLEQGANLTDVFVTHERNRVPGKGFRTYDDLFEGDIKTRLHKIDKLSDPQNVEVLRDIDPSVIIMNFSEIVRPDILEIPRVGVFGFHYAKLPDRRGCNPVNWAMLHDLHSSEVTFHQYTPDIDRGGIVDTEPFKIGTDYHSAVLERVHGCLRALLDRNLQALIDSSATINPQRGPGIYTPRLTFEDGKVVFPRSTAEDVTGRVRAFSEPFAGAYAMAGPRGAKEKLYILEAHTVPYSIVDSGRVIDWKEPKEEIHNQVSFGKAYALTGNGAVRITKTRLGELESG